MQGRLVKSHRGFPKPKQAIWEAPEALGQPQAVVARVFPPGENDGWYSPVARKTGVPRARCL